MNVLEILQVQILVNISATKAFTELNM